MTLFRFSYAPMIGALVGICALIPIVGAVIGTVVGAFMILMVDPVPVSYTHLDVYKRQILKGERSSL